MVENINIGGKVRPFLLGNAAFKMYKQRTGKTLLSFIGELQDGELFSLSDLVYCGLRVGEIWQKTPEPDQYNEMEVAIWMDLYEGGAIEFMKKVLDSMPKPDAKGGVPDESGEPQATGTGTN